MEKMKFPIVGASKCPGCGSEKKLGETYFSELEADGKVPKGSLKDGLQIQFPVMQTMMSPVAIKPEIPVLLISFEVCSACFTMYVTGVKLVSQPVHMQFGQPPGMKPGFMKG